MVPVADRGLSHLRDQCLRVAQQKQPRGVSLKLIFEFLSGQAVRMASALHERPTRRAFTAHEKSNTDEALVAYHRDFCRGAILHYVKQRHDCIRWKVNMTQRIAGLVQDLAERHGHQFELRKYALTYRGGQRGKKMILRGTRRLASELFFHGRVAKQMEVRIVYPYGTAQCARGRAVWSTSTSGAKTGAEMTEAPAEN